MYIRNGKFKRRYYGGYWLLGGSQLLKTRVKKRKFIICVSDSHKPNKFINKEPLLSGFITQMCLTSTAPKPLENLI